MLYFYLQQRAFAWSVDPWKVTDYRSYTKTLDFTLLEFYFVQF